MLLGRGLRLWSTEPVPRLAEFLGVHQTSILRTPNEADGRTGVVAMVLGDPRFSALDTQDLRTRPSWARYRSRT